MTVFCYGIFCSKILVRGNFIGKLVRVFPDYCRRHSLWRDWTLNRRYLRSVQYLIIYITEMGNSSILLDQTFRVFSSFFSRRTNQKLLSKRWNLYLPLKYLLQPAANISASLLVFKIIDLHLNLYLLLSDIYSFIAWYTTTCGLYYLKN